MTAGSKVWWTAAEAAAELGIAVKTLYDEKALGKIGYEQRGRGCKLRFRREHLDAYAAGVDPVADELSRRRRAAGDLR